MNVRTAEALPIVEATWKAVVYAEAEDPDWARRLTQEEAELAARYAFVELNGYPHWIAALVDAHASTVERVVGSQVDFDLKEDLGQEQWHSMSLQSLRYGPLQLARLLAPRLVHWLKRPGEQLMQNRHTTVNESKLDHVVSVLMAGGDDPTLKFLEKLALEQVRPSEYGSFLLFWLPVLCAVNPERGMAELLTILDGLPVEKDGVAVQAIGSLFHDRRSKGVVEWRTELTVEMLLKSTIAIHRHVRSEDDNRHEEVYSPNYRDAAEDGRRYVFDALMQAEGAEALRAKLSLSQNPLFAHLRDRIAAIAQELVATALDSQVAEVSELAALFAGKDLPPKTGTDMAQLLVDRLDDLQDLMLRDAGPRAAWAVVNDENTLRPAIARELEIAARSAYTVDQEAVTADGKETDIRLRSISGQQATIELKIGEKSRSAKVLRDTVEKQLVLKYMASKSARTGCLLVTVAKPNRHWLHPDTNTHIDRFELQALLDAAAQAAQEKLGGDARVLARVLDLTPRLMTEVEAAGKAPAAKRRSGKPARKTTTSARRTK
ncbi:hypothetical protein GNZ12_30465 [Paraburkholderia sp. 1N]|uniref:Uncharacterized protein n=1 Tax=Paraburkholderia solitsugae TaxID=2675748 RepID=A0ABX2C0M4_9BURK|nr:hypothetical protein [Paraburkholderia solitsugae]NPT45570.1 hypothetical protein [Paraburkholderia solitsugae]